MPPRTLAGIHRHDSHVTSRPAKLKSPATVGRLRVRSSHQSLQRKPVTIDLVANAFQGPRFEAPRIARDPRHIAK
jgi:hypothetical protein